MVKARTLPEGRVGDVGVLIQRDKHFSAVVIPCEAVTSPAC